MQFVGALAPSFLFEDFNKVRAAFIQDFASEDHTSACALGLIIVELEGSVSATSLNRRPRADRDGTLGE